MPVRLAYDTSVKHLYRKGLEAALPRSFQTKIPRIKALLENPGYQHWPIRSIAHHALRQKKVLLSPQTWYRYVLGISRKPIPKKCKRISIRASRPDQYWHADVTIFKTADGVRHYIHLVLDNFSRKILSWRVATRLSASLSLATLRDAHAHASGSKINMIVDGGSENHAQIIEDFIAQNHIQIQKKIALRHVHFSNSLIESVNKLLKYRYLFPRKVANGTALNTHLAEAIQNYNDVRPHGLLNGLTPSQAYQRREIPERPYTAILKQAKTARLEQNRQDICGISPK